MTGWSDGGGRRGSGGGGGVDVVTKGFLIFREGEECDESDEGIDRGITNGGGGGGGGGDCGFWDAIEILDGGRGAGVKGALQLLVSIIVINKIRKNLKFFILLLNFSK